MEKAYVIVSYWTLDGADTKKIEKVYVGSESLAQINADNMYSDYAIDAATNGFAYIEIETVDAEVCN